MINLAILVGAMLVAFRLISPLLRIAITMLAKLVSFTFLIALAIILFAALITHGMFI